MGFRCSGSVTECKGGLVIRGGQAEFSLTYSMILSIWYSLDSRA